MSKEAAPREDPFRPPVAARVARGLCKLAGPLVLSGRATYGLPHLQYMAQDVPRAPLFPRDDSVYTLMGENGTPLDQAWLYLYNEKRRKMSQKQWESYRLALEMKQQLVDMASDHLAGTKNVVERLYEAIHKENPTAGQVIPPDQPQAPTVRTFADELAAFRQYETDLASCPDQNLLSGKASKQELFAPTEDEKQVGQYLGYQDEKELIRSIPSDIFQLLLKNGVSQPVAQSVLRRYTEVLAYAAPLHAEFNKKRASDESYASHLVRTCWYGLTALSKFGLLPTDESSLNKFIEVSLLHDVEEDIRTKDDVHAAQYVQDKSDPEKWTLHSPTDQSGNTFATLTGLHRDTVTSLKALNSARGKEGDALYNVVADDPSGIAAWVKCYGDRIDNLMTMWYHKTYIDYYKKLIETEHSMSAIATFAHHKLQQRALYPIQHVLAQEQCLPHSAWVNAAYLLTIGQKAATRSVLFAEMCNRAGIPHPDPENVENMRQRMTEQFGVQNGPVILDTEYPLHFGIKALAARYMQQRTQVNGTKEPKSPQIGKRPLPFGFSDIAIHAEHVQNHHVNGFALPQYDIPLARASIKGNRKVPWKMTVDRLKDNMAYSVNETLEHAANVFQGSGGFLP